jgi:hypothetical protein
MGTSLLPGAVGLVYNSNQAGGVTGAQGSDNQSGPAEPEEGRKKDPKNQRPALSATASKQRRDGERQEEKEATKSSAKDPQANKENKQTRKGQKPKKKNKSQEQASVTANAPRVSLAGAVQEVSDSTALGESTMPEFQQVQVEEQGQKRKNHAEEVNKTYGDIHGIAGYNGKVGLDGYGCEHYGMQQIKEEKVIFKDIAYYMQEGEFLHGTICAGTCNFPADKLDRKTCKEVGGDGMLYFCSMWKKDQRCEKCVWYCVPCWTTAANNEEKEMAKISGGVTTGRAKRTRGAATSH